MKRLYESGKMLREIAIHFQKSFQGVHYALQKQGTLFRPKGGARPSNDIVLRNQQIKEAYQAGRSISQLAQTHRISRQRVHQILKGLKVRRRPPGYSRERHSRAPHSEGWSGPERIRAFYAAAKDLKRKPAQFVVPQEIEGRPVTQILARSSEVQDARAEAAKILKRMGGPFVVPRCFRLSVPMSALRKQGVVDYIAAKMITENQKTSTG